MFRVFVFHIETCSKCNIKERKEKKVSENSNHKREVLLARSLTQAPKQRNDKLTSDTHLEHLFGRYIVSVVQRRSRRDPEGHTALFW